MATVVVFFVDVALGLPARVFFGDAFLVGFVTADFVPVAFDDDLAADDLTAAGLAAGFLVVADDGLVTVFVVVLDDGLVTVFEVVLETGFEF